MPFLELDQINQGEMKDCKVQIKQRPALMNFSAKWIYETCSKTVETEDANKKKVNETLLFFKIVSLTFSKHIPID